MILAIVQFCVIVALTVDNIKLRTRLTRMEQRLHKVGGAYCDLLETIIKNMEAQ